MRLEKKWKLAVRQKERSGEVVALLSHVMRCTLAFPRKNQRMENRLERRSRQSQFVLLRYY
jgi:hypothetical protein